MDIAEDKGDNLPLVVTHYIVPRSRKSTIAGKDNGEKGGVQGKGCYYCVHDLVPDMAILSCPYNHSQQLEGRADGTSTYPRDPIQEEEIYYKEGGNPLTEGRDQRRLPEPCRGPILPDELSPSYPDRVKHHDNFCSYTKAQLFSPLSTNSLYRARWFKVPRILGRTRKIEPYNCYYLFVIHFIKYILN